MSRAAQETSGVRALHKTLDILEVIKAAPAGLRLADLSRNVAMPQATVYRILTTLEGRGYPDRGEDGNYPVSKKLFAMQEAVPIAQVLNRVAQPLIRNLG